MAKPITKTLTLLTLATLALGGCGVLEDRSQRYVDEPLGQPLRVGEGQQGDRIRDVFPIRPVEGGSVPERGTFKLPAPPDMTSDILEQNYVVETLGGQTWLLVNEVPGRVWPAVSAWKSERGLGVARDNPQIGLMQSDVVNFSRRARDFVGLDDAEDADSLRVTQARIAPGVRRRTTEIQVRLRGVDSAPRELLSWAAQSEALETEQALLQDLADYLKAREDTKSYSRVALGITAEPMVRLVAGDDTKTHIVMDLDYERAWLEVSRSLAEAGVPVVDLDRSAGQFYVDFRSQDELKRGWFRRAAEPEFTFLVQLQRQDDGVHIMASRAPDHAGPDRSERLLAELFEYLY